MTTRLAASCLLAGVVLSCARAPGSVRHTGRVPSATQDDIASAAASANSTEAQPTHAFRVGTLTPVWMKTFPPSGEYGVCPLHWVTDGDGAIFMTGGFEGELNLDAVRLKSTAPTAYLARLSANGEAEWARALPGLDSPKKPQHGLFEVDQVAVFGERVLVAGSGFDGPAARFVYGKSGVLEKRHVLSTGEVSFPLLVGADSWLIDEFKRDRTTRLVYRDESGKGWQKEFHSSQMIQSACSSDGRIAFVGRLNEQGSTNALERVSVLSTDSGTLLSTIVVPTGTNPQISGGIHGLGFDSKHRLWITAESALTFDEFQSGRHGTSTRSNDLVLVVGSRGERIAWLWADGAEASMGLSALLPDGRAMLRFGGGRPVTIRTSFAGSTRLDPGHSLLEIDLEKRQITRYAIPENTSCLAATTDGRLLGCFKHMVKKGVVAWPARCDLVKWTLTPRPEGAMR